MQYISYRGLVNGQDPQAANTPAQIAKAFGFGFACMVDAWRVSNIIYLGSDLPLTEVSPNYLKGKKFYINARNADMYSWLQTQSLTDYPNYFTISLPLQNYYTTSNTTLWTFQTNPVNNNSIMVLPESYDSGLFSTVNLRCFGVCSSLCPTIKRMRNEGLSIYGPFY